jgi:hypothetical protein
LHNELTLLDFECLVDKLRGSDQEFLPRRSTSNMARRNWGSWLIARHSWRPRANEHMKKLLGLKNLVRLDYLSCYQPFHWTIISKLCNRITVCLDVVGYYISSCCVLWIAYFITWAQINYSLVRHCWLLFVIGSSIYLLQKRKGLIAWKKSLLKIITEYFLSSHNLN